MIDIKKYRNKMQLSQLGLAKLLNMSPTSIQYYEKHKYNPSYNTILKLKKIIKEQLNEDLNI